jgi:hypothetical protein
MRSSLAPSTKDRYRAVRMVFKRLTRLGAVNGLSSSWFVVVKNVGPPVV